MKEIYLVRGEVNGSYPDFKNKIFNLLQKINTEVPLTTLRVTLTEESPPHGSVIPFRKQKIACISITREPGEPVALLKDIPGFAGVFRVTEAIPVAYEKTWNDGEMTPGVCLLTLFTRKKEINYQYFLERWHNSHTPLSLKIHPLWNYNRNVVREAAGQPLKWYDGIVEEHFRSKSDLVNPFRFFGNPLVIIPHMIQVYLDTNAFLEYPEIEPYFAREYWIKSNR